MNSSISRLVPVFAVLATLVSCSQPGLHRLGGDAGSVLASSIASLLARTPLPAVEPAPRELIDSLEDCGGGDPAMCILPPMTHAQDVTTERSLQISDLATLNAADFSLRRTLSTLAGQVVPGRDEKPVGEAMSAALRLDVDPDAFQIVALRNHLERADSEWRNCGEFHIVYRKPAANAEDDGSRIVLELTLPNPKPGCREGCLEVARFWQALSVEADAGARGRALARFFYTGLPGFRPTVHVEHLSARGAPSSYGFSGAGRLRVEKPGSETQILRTSLSCGKASCHVSLVRADEHPANQVTDSAHQSRFMLSLLNQSRCGCHNAHQLLSDANSRQQALYVQQRIATRFAPRIAHLRRQLQNSDVILDAEQRHHMIDKLFSQMDREVEYALREAKIKPPMLNPSPDSLMLLATGY